MLSELSMAARSATERDTSMDNRFAAAARFLAPAVLAVGTLLASTPAFAGGDSLADHAGPSTPASRAMVAKAHSATAHMSARHASFAPRAMSQVAMSRMVRRH